MGAVVPSRLIWTAQSWPQARRLGPGGCGRRPGGRLPGATVPRNGTGSVETAGPWVGSVLPQPFCFCIRGKLFFLGYIYTSQIRKCPNQMGQVATGNHSSKPFFFFPFLSETSRKRKVNDMSVGCLMHTASSALHTDGAKRERDQAVSSRGSACISPRNSVGREVVGPRSCQHEAKIR